MTTSLNKDPLVSIIIPVYNGTNFLGEAIDSALAQTYKNIEILVVNDGSEDKEATEKVALSYGNRVRYFKKENGGVGSALNLGIRESRGEYFSWLSHDDLYYPHRIDTMVRAVIASGDLTAPAYSNYDRIDIDVGILHHVRHEETYSLEELTNGTFIGIFALSMGTTWLIHMSHFQRVGMFDEELLVSQDLEMRFRLFRGQKVIFVDTPTVCERGHRERGSRTVLPKRIKEVHNTCYNVLTSISASEIDELFGGEYHFYQRMLWYHTRNTHTGMAEMIYHRFIKIPIPDSEIKKYKLVLDQFYDWSGGKAHMICIFGAGHYGGKVINKLAVTPIRVAYFLDNNPDKLGKKHHWVECVKPDKINVEETLIIVAIKHPVHVFNQLKAMNAKHVVTNAMVEEILLPFEKEKYRL